MTTAQSVERMETELAARQDQPGLPFQGPAILEGRPRSCERAAQLALDLRKELVSSRTAVTVDGHHHRRACEIPGPEGGSRLSFCRTSPQAGSSRVDQAHTADQVVRESPRSLAPSRDRPSSTNAIRSPSPKFPGFSICSCGIRCFSKTRHRGVVSDRWAASVNGDEVRQPPRVCAAPLGRDQGRSPGEAQDPGVGQRVAHVFIRWCPYWVRAPSGPQ